MWLLKFCQESNLRHLVRTEAGWTEHMRRIFEAAAAQGITKQAMKSCLQDMDLSPGMEQLFRFLRQNRGDFKVCVISRMKSGDDMSHCSNPVSL